MAIELSREKIYTLAEFRQLPQTKERYELVDGRLVEVTPAREDHGRIETRLLTYLSYYVFEHELGDTYGADTCFQIGEDALSPDGSFVAKGRIETSERGAVIIGVVPDLVFEVKSPTETLPKLKNKVEKYLNAGVQLVWVVYPLREEIEVYQKNSPKSHLLHIGEILDGGQVLPDFSVELKKLFTYAGKN